MNGATWLLTAALVAQANVASGAGDAAFARGDFDAAFRAYSAAVAASPRDFDALLGLGTMDLYRGDLAQAHLYLTEALQVNPSDAVAQRRLHALRALEGPPGDFEVSMSAREVDVPFVATDPLPMVHAEINGVDGLFVIDTGAPGIELTAPTAARLHVQMHVASEGIFAGGKTARLYAGRVDSIGFRGALVRGVPVGQIPAAMPTTLGGRAYDGVIGTNLLRRFLSTIDYRDGKLVLRPRSASAAFEATARAHNDAIVPMWLVPDHFIFARATVNGSLQGLFSIDTGGAGLGISLTKASLAAANITPDESKAASGFGGGGAVRVVPFSAATVTLGSFARRDVPGLFTPSGDPYGRFPFAVAGALTHAFFRTSALTFDFSAMKLIVASPASMESR